MKRRTRPFNNERVRHQIRSWCWCLCGLTHSETFFGINWPHGASGAACLYLKQQNLYRFLFFWCGSEKCLFFLETSPKLQWCCHKEEMFSNMSFFGREHTFFCFSFKFHDLWCTIYHSRNTLTLRTQQILVFNFTLLSWEFLSVIIEIRIMLW